MADIEDPLEILRCVMVALQRARSVSAETVGNEDLIAKLQPWLVGPLALLPHVIELVDRAETTGVPPAPTDVLNILTVLRTIDGGRLGVLCDVFTGQGDDIPADPMAWFLSNQVR